MYLTWVRQPFARVQVTKLNTQGKRSTDQSKCCHEKGGKVVSDEGHSKPEANIPKGYESDDVLTASEVEKALNSDHEEIHEMRERNIAMLASQKSNIAFNSGARIKKDQPSETDPGQANEPSQEHAQHHAHAQHLQGNAEQPSERNADHPNASNLEQHYEANEETEANVERAIEANTEQPTEAILEQPTEAITEQPT
ncbi:uncharacterized protein A4U43_C05F16500 [Asparagus officinalis]|uniref:Uncharacterized protein n=1 Tax=Asparagus officinalis TaxID=4686 RepID=A0A5P1ESQ4_ASPOF|nr:uncharacterized protein A4U43_C05F16500 [Asparagus officinalis]